MPLRIINSVAPIRIADNGGWTDTWFAEHGKIFNIGVYPYAEVQIEVYPYEGGPERIVIQAENYGDRYEVLPDKARWNKHPLLEAAIQYMRIPEDIAFQVTIYSEVPAGASTGTSAAVSVALIGALDRLSPGTMTPHEVVRHTGPDLFGVRRDQFH
jgi:D-glycero-alpha-D-manno-heptose-7-phosphate kinase